MQQLTEDVQEGCRKLRLRELHFDPEAEDTTTPPRFYKATGYRPPEGRDRGLDVYCDLLQSRTENYTCKTRPTDNMKPTERKALSELCAWVMTRTICISPADKGGAIVVQDTTDYVAEAERQLSNAAHYKKVDKDPTVEVATQSNTIEEELFVCGHIDENTQRWAHTDNRDERTHIYYHLPKVHRQLIKPPGRPIISGTNGPTEKLSQLIDSWLQEYVSGLQSFVKDSTHMLNIIQEWNIEYGPFEDVTLVTLTSPAYTPIFPMRT